jgi:hypothetical protein
MQLEEEKDDDDDDNDDDLDVTLPKKEIKDRHKIFPQEILFLNHLHPHHHHHH